MIKIKNKTNKVLKIIFAVIFFVLLFSVISLIINSFWSDKNSSSGHYTGKTQEQIIADLNAQVAEGEMNVSIANTIQFPNGSENEGFARIENIAANHVDQKVKMFLGESNELIYESGAIAPNNHIDFIKLNKYIEPGLYKAFVIVDGYKQNNNSTIEGALNNLFNNHIKTGSAGAQINLIIE